MAADGSIIIDTRIDTRGFTTGKNTISKGLTGLTGSLKKFGAVVGTVFAVGQIINFGKEASAAARQASDSMKGLQSILEGQGRSFSKAQEFIKEYISDGLIPATNATTAYKNLASRGYDDTQIQQVLVALKDASAYGRQASYSMGEAVQSATEGLKNENSILVDNAGVTKNVAKMWEEYAASIGTTANNLTQQQKIQAEVTGILAETRFQAGDAAKVAGTLSGQLQQLSFNFNNLKVAVGNIINPFVQAFLPAINAAVTAVTKFANVIASLVNSFFGTSMNMLETTTTNVATGYDNAADSAENLANATDKNAKATKKAEKANKGYLSGLDEIRKYTADKNDSNTTASTPSSSGGTSGGGINYTPVKNGQAVAEQVASKFEQLANKIRGYMKPLTTEIERFKNIAVGAFTWFFNNVLKPLGSWTVNEVLPRFFQTLGNALKIVNNILIALEPLWMWFWNNVLKPVATWTGGVFLTIWDGINIALGNFADWCAENPGIIQTAAIVIAAFFLAFKIVEFVSLIGGIVGALGSFIGQILNLSTSVGGGTILTGLFGKAIAALTSPFGIAVIAVGLLIAAGVLLWKNWDKVKEKAKQLKEWVVEKFEDLKEKCVSAVEFFKEKAGNAWEALGQSAEKVSGWIHSKFESLSNWITNAFTRDWTEDFGSIGLIINGFFDTVSSVSSGVQTAFQGIIDFVAGVFTGDWERAWNGVLGIFQGIFEGLGAIFKVPLNAVIGMMNNMITMINFFIRKVNDIFTFEIKFSLPDWLGGASYTFGHKMSIPKLNYVPYLATGAVIPPNAPFMAMLGDQKNGTNLEAPESLLRQIVREETATDNNGGGNYRFTAQINRRTLFDEVIEEAKIRQSATGVNPFAFG